MKPTKFSVTWHNTKGEFKCIETDNREIAEKKAILNNGELWINTRYDAEIRLRRIYLRLQAQNKLPVSVDYPHLIN